MYIHIIYVYINIHACIIISSHLCFKGVFINYCNINTLITIITTIIIIINISNSNQSYFTSSLNYLSFEQVLTYIAKSDLLKLLRICNCLKLSQL